MVRNTARLSGASSTMRMAGLRDGADPMLVRLGIRCLARAARCSIAQNHTALRTATGKYCLFDRKKCDSGATCGYYLKTDSCAVSFCRQQDARGPAGPRG